MGNSGNRDLESEGDAVSGPSAAAPRGQYLEQGFVVVPGLLSSEELDALRQDTDRAVRERIAPILFEDESDAAAAAVPDLYKSPDGRVFRRLNRVIERGGAFERVVFGPLAAAVAGIVPPPLTVCLNRHNMVMLKAPHNPAVVAWHQDAPVWNEGTFEHLTAVVALDDFRTDNGCLDVVPGSHRLGTIGLGWPENPEQVWARHRDTIERHAVPVPLRAGDALVMHGLLLHGSAGNRSARPRRSLTVAFFPGDLSVASTHADNPPEVRSVLFGDASEPVRRT